MNVGFPADTRAGSNGSRPNPGPEHLSELSLGICSCFDACRHSYLHTCFHGVVGTATPLAGSHVAQRINDSRCVESQTCALVPGVCADMQQPCFGLVRHELARLQRYFAARTAQPHALALHGIVRLASCSARPARAAERRRECAGAREASVGATRRRPQPLSASASAHGSGVRRRRAAPRRRRIFALDVSRSVCVCVCAVSEGAESLVRSLSARSRLFPDVFPTHDAFPRSRWLNCTWLLCRTMRGVSCLLRLLRGCLLRDM